jgi:hypothetical protein
MQKGLSGFHLKLIGITFMVVDHVNSYVGDFLGLPLWVALLGRFVAPLFAFLMIEGFFNTHNKRRYFTRLFIGGVLMYAVNITHNVLTKKSFVDPLTKQFDIFAVLQGQNIFMTLALLLLLVWLLDTLRHGPLSRFVKGGLVVGAICLLPLILMSEGGPYELVLALIFYFFRGNFLTIASAILIFSAALFGHTLFGYFTSDGFGTLYQTLTFDNEFMIFFVLPLVHLYNGQRGGSGATWQKQLFYYFYPAHLILIYLLHDVVNGVF